MKQKQGKVQKEAVLRRQAEQMPKEKREMLEKCLQDMRQREEAEEKGKEEALQEQVLDEMVDKLLQHWQREARARKPQDKIGLAWLEDTWVDFLECRNQDSKMYMLFEFKDGDEIHPEELEGLAFGESPTEYPTVIERDWHRFNRLRGCQGWYTASLVWQEWMELHRREE